MSRYKPYLRYKESGVAWLGEVPEGWEVKKLKYCLTLQNKKMPIDDKIVIALENIESGTGKLLESDTNYQGEDVSCKKNDILFGKLRPYLSKVYLCRDDGIAFGDLLSYRPNEDFNALYAFYTLLSHHFIHIVDSSTYGTKMPRASADFIGEMPILNPAFDEQTAIADFLDRETAKIDTLISKQERLIELLREKRQALISHAVTKGLDPNVKMKESGVEWLGEVPEHWEICRIGNIFREATEYGKTDLPILRVSIHDGVSDREYLTEEMDRKVARSEDRSKYKCVKPGDLVYNMMRAWQGGFGAVKVDGLVSPAYVVAKPLKPLDTTFVELLLRTKPATEEMRRYSRGITDFRLRLYWEEFKNLKIVFPPKEEVRDILSYIETQNDHVDKLVNKARQSITLLKERRTALISAAVTGKIDVREEVS